MEQGTYNADLYMEPKEQRKVDAFIVYAMAAANQALTDAEWFPKSDEDQICTGVLIGSGIGGLRALLKLVIRFVIKVRAVFLPFYSRTFD